MLYVKYISIKKKRNFCIPEARIQVCSNFSFIISQDHDKEIIWASNVESIFYIKYFAKQFLHVISYNVKD